MTKKHFFGLLAILILVGLILAAAIGSSWFTNKNFKTWFNGWGQGQGQEEKKDISVPVAITDSGEFLYSGEMYAMPRSMTFTMSEQDKPEYVESGELIITATSSNEYINGEYDFTAAWENSSSEWASGKTTDYYLTLTPVEGAADKVKVTVSEPFAEPIIITAQLRGNGESGKVGTCKIDYLQRLTFSEYLLGPDFADSACLAGKYNYGVGTVQSNCNLTSLTLNPTEEFRNNFQSFLKFDVDLKAYSFHNFSTWLNGGDFEFSSDEVLDYSMFVVGFNDFNDNQKQAVYYAWNKAYKLNEYNMLLDFDIECVYNEVRVGGVTETDFSGVGKVSGNYYYDEYVNVNVLINGGYVF